MKWSKEQKLQLAEIYPSHGKKYCAQFLNKSEPQIRSMASSMGLRLCQDSEFFKDFQRRAAQSKIGKKRPAQALVMKKLHADGKLLMTEETKKIIGLLSSERIRLNGHPRGMLGKTHSIKNKEKLSANTKKLWADKNSKFNSDEYRQGVSDRMSKMMQKRIFCKGSVYSRSHNGWYLIGGRRFYFRSSWEVTYARFLESLKNSGQIKEWDYEVETFWFEGIKRGVRSYTPDFFITNVDSTTEFHEVKGWMDSKSKTKINRMRIYHPHIVLKIIDKPKYTPILKLSDTYPVASKEI